MGNRNIKIKAYTTDCDLCCNRTHWWGTALNLGLYCPVCDPPDRLAYWKALHTLPDNKDREAHLKEWHRLCAQLDVGKDDDGNARLYDEYAFIMTCKEIDWKKIDGNGFAPPTNKYTADPKKLVEEGRARREALLENHRPAPSLMKVHTPACDCGAASVKDEAHAAWCSSKKKWASYTEEPPQV